MVGDLGSKISESAGGLVQDARQAVLDEGKKGVQTIGTQTLPFLQQQQTDKKIEELKKEDEEKKEKEIPEIEEELKEEADVMKSKKVIMEHHEAAQKLGQPEEKPEDQFQGPPIAASKEITPLDQDMTQAEKPLAVRQAETKIETGRGNKG